MQKITLVIVQNPSSWHHCDRVVDKKNYDTKLLNVAAGHKIRKWRTL